MNMRINMLNFRALFVWFCLFSFPLRQNEPEPKPKQYRLLHANIQNIQMMFALRVMNINSWHSGEIWLKTC